MLDRWGHPIIVGWSDHQILWIEAALTLDGQERRNAFQDIAELVGRPYASVWAKAVDIERKQIQARQRERLAGLSKGYLAKFEAAE